MTVPPAKEIRILREALQMCDTRIEELQRRLTNMQNQYHNLLRLYSEVTNVLRDVNKINNTKDKPMTQNKPYTEHVPTNEPDENTVVYVWMEYDDGKSEWETRRANLVECHECGAKYDAETWVWENPLHKYPFLVCECGEQFMQTVEE